MAIDADVRVLLDDAPTRFGLRAQGHLPTIETMLGNGHTWDQIAHEIGWQRCAARSHFEHAVGEEDTKELRSVLAEAIEVLRALHKKHRHAWDGNDSNSAAHVFAAANRLLESQTRFDFSN